MHNRVRISESVLMALLLAAMGMPMMVFYAVGVLGPEIMRTLQLPVAALGWLTTATFGVAAAASLMAGALVSRIGVRRSLLALFVLVALSFGLIRMTSGFYGLLMALLVCGLAQALANPSTNQAIAHWADPERKAFLVGLKQSGVQLSALLAGALMPLLAGWLSWQDAFLLWVPVLIVLALQGARMMPRDQGVRPSRPMSVMRPGRALILLAQVQLGVGLALSSFMTYLGVFAAEMGVSPESVGMMVMLFGVTGVLARTLLTPLARNWSDESLMLGVLILGACVALSVMQLTTPAHHLPLWSAVTGIGATLVATNAIAMSMLLHDPGFGEVSRASGWLSAGFFTGFALGPPGFGALVATWGFTIALWGLVACLLLALVAVVLLAGHRRRRAALSPASG